MAYQDFKSYIADKYMDLLYREISDYVGAHHDGIGFHGHSVLSLCEQRVENIEVKSLRCVAQPDPFVKIDVNVTDWEHRSMMPTGRLNGLLFIWMHRSETV